MSMEIVKVKQRHSPVEAIRVNISSLPQKQLNEFAGKIAKHSGKVVRAHPSGSIVMDEAGANGGDIWAHNGDWLVKSDTGFWAAMSDESFQRNVKIVEGDDDC